MIRLGITGTDTGVGKTVVATALIARLRAQGLRVAAMKPVETGVADGTDPPDAAALRSAAGAGDAIDAVCPVVLSDPLAPLIAAERANRAIDIESLDTAFGTLCRDRDAIIVEGAGGLLVPLTPDIAYDALFYRWGLDLVIVAANRLGVINPVLLTVRAAERAGLPVRAIVLNELREGAATDLAERTNLSALRRLLPGHRVLSFPYVAPPHIPEILADHLAWDP
jgi:dethiobiotin synthetase